MWAEGLLYIIKWNERFEKQHVQDGFLVTQKYGHRKWIYIDNITISLLPASSPFPRQILMGYRFRATHRAGPENTAHDKDGHCLCSGT